ncbi:hypothetical protein [Streptomyces caelestis]|uniref:hypothetical protein n=1 Tax=Streptomyces caelestis TaxID=36816 RepID=UPI0036573E0C
MIARVATTAALAIGMLAVVHPAPAEAAAVDTRARYVPAPRAHASGHAAVVTDAMLRCRATPWVKVGDIGSA